ncbi:unnamed protein product, partial [Discosporangium mesarthrocarpum]
VTVNGKWYEKIGDVGAGGSSKVYRVLNDENRASIRVLALKHVRVERPRGDRRSVDLDNYAREISILEKLRGSPAIINLKDWEVSEV